MRKLIALILILACIANLVGCSSKMSLDIAGANKIELCSGNDGIIVVVADEESIRYITDNINALQFSKGKSSKDSTGWSYWLKWYDSEDNLIEELVVMSEYQIDYKGSFYSGMDADAEIDITFFDTLLNA